MCSQTRKYVCSGNMCCGLEVGMEAITWGAGGLGAIFMVRGVSVQELALVVDGAHFFSVLCLVALGW